MIEDNIMKLCSSVKPNDVIFVPVCVGVASPSKRSEIINESAAKWNEAFPYNRIIIHPYKNEMQFYYPIVFNKESLGKV